MHNGWSDLVRDGGISAPAWTFFTLIASGVGKLIWDSVSTKRKLDDAAEAAKKAAVSVAPISNGFAANVIAALNRIESKYDDLDKKLDNHIENSNERH